MFLRFTVFSVLVFSLLVSWQTAKMRKNGVFMRFQFALGVGFQMIRGGAPHAKTGLSAAYK